MYKLTFHPLFQLCTGGSSIPGPGLGPNDFQGSCLATPSVVEAHRKQISQAPCCRFPSILVAGYACSPRVFGLLVLSPIHSLKTQVIQSTDLEMIKAIKCSLLTKKRKYSKI